MIYIVSIGIGCLVVIILLSTKKTSKSDNQVPIDKELLLFLEKADDAYIKTHETVDIQYFSKFATHSLCNQVLDDIHKKPPKMFGIAKHRERKWRLVTEEKNEFTFEKNITHRHIQVKKGIIITLGDDMNEVWLVSNSPKGFLVRDVT